MNPITYTSDQLADYSKALSECSSLADLNAVLHDYRSLAKDAIDTAPKDDEEFRAFQEGLFKERKGVFAGEAFAERYGLVLMPTVLLEIGMIAAQYLVPWGCAYIRMLDAGRLFVDLEGTVSLLDPAPKA